MARKGVVNANEVRAQIIEGSLTFHFLCFVTATYRIDSIRYFEQTQTLIKVF